MKKFEDVFYAMNFVGEKASLAAAKVTLDYYLKNNVAREINQKRNFYQLN